MTCYDMDQSSSQRTTTTRMTDSQLQLLLTKTTLHHIQTDETRQTNKLTDVFITRGHGFPRPKNGIIRSRCWHCLLHSTAWSDNLKLTSELDSLICYRKLIDACNVYSDTTPLDLFELRRRSVCSDPPTQLDVELSCVAINGPLGI